MKVYNAKSIFCVLFSLSAVLTIEPSQSQGTSESTNPSQIADPQILELLKLELPKDAVVPEGVLDVSKMLPEDDTEKVCKLNRLVSYEKAISLAAIEKAGPKMLLEATAASLRYEEKDQIIKGLRKVYDAYVNSEPADRHRFVRRTLFGPSKLYVDVNRVYVHRRQDNSVPRIVLKLLRDVIRNPMRIPKYLMPPQVPKEVLEYKEQVNKNTKLLIQNVLENAVCSRESGAQVVAKDKVSEMVSSLNDHLGSNLVDEAVKQSGTVLTNLEKKIGRKAQTVEDNPVLWRMVEAFRHLDTVEIVLSDKPKPNEVSMIDLMHLRFNHRIYLDPTNANNDVSNDKSILLNHEHISMDYINIKVDDPSYLLNQNLIKMIQSDIFKKIMEKHKPFLVLTIKFTSSAGEILFDTSKMTHFAKHSMDLFNGLKIKFDHFAKLPDEQDLAQIIEYHFGSLQDLQIVVTTNDADQEVYSSDGFKADNVYVSHTVLNQIEDEQAQKQDASRIEEIEDENQSSTNEEAKDQQNDSKADASGANTSGANPTA